MGTSASATSQAVPFAPTHQANHQGNGMAEHRRSLQSVKQSQQQGQIHHHKQGGPCCHHVSDKDNTMLFKTDHKGPHMHEMSHLFATLMSENIVDTINNFTLT